MQNKFWLFGLLVFILSACGGDSSDPTPTPDPEPEVIDFSSCLTNVSDQTLEVVTWNVENFPTLATTVDMVEMIIEQFDADIIALQEIRSVADFNNLVAEMTGWSGHVEHVSGSSQRLAFLYKDSEITVIDQPRNLYPEDTEDYDNAFTSVRRPLYVKVEHSSGMQVDLINVHLKCCSGSEDRRRRASVLIKEYIDENLPNNNVIFLGDFNDEIVDQQDNVFQNFIDDADNYLFATMSIANGPSSHWSYPSWPSQIDQILISNELFDNEILTQTIRLDECYADYENKVSDHRPVLIKLSTN
ncbi:MULTISPECIES: endonuclease/exonuclease/phosphatase family protein [Roseivirga]|uniref:Endonuclease/exonuclease/phosphatase domain-containing protein n=1 Tax=Roseivirga thermotolerans TaxID=1758176 RepID=A0ABQ3IAF9_9BACT|nr:MULTISPECIES: endonuclease/exonuclease/phosphatase family protein [Roseivirga]GHE69331.1 hypothetical protein GCM10011340_26610 [Roseivirga thermotolerans]|tara:strand:+ start:15488 stop:16390 length:903 start_codon:yes stop_codon:yes gene_type:complete